MRIDGQNPLLTPAMLAALTAKDEIIGADAPRAEAKPPPPLTPQTAATAIPQPATSVAMLVALASEEPVERRRRAIDNAQRGLTMLDRLRDGLATGVVAPERLRELAQWAEGFTLPDDPALADIARDIELRVRVELAKHDVSL